MGRPISGYVEVVQVDRSIDRDNGWKTTFAGIMLIAASILLGLTFTLVIAGVAESKRVAPAGAQPAAPPAAEPAANSAAASAPAPISAAPTPVPTPATTAPAAAAAVAPAQASGDATAGTAAFNTSCGGCHPKGGAGVGPDLHGFSADSISSTVRAGKGIMPAFGSDKVSDKQLLDIVAFLRTLN